MELADIIHPKNLVYKKPALLTSTTMHYCPGCSHGVIHRLLAEVIEDLGIQ
ncbi:MAG: 2-oxoglutarate oxidoreductase, partial [Bacteroidota bacterium]|nr:2-oxoglutarate oxidoreductase [Bacteroidota bacterium]